MSPRSPDQNRQRRQRTRRHLLDASLRVFAERGPGAAMSEIAEAAGVSKGLAYHYFTSKEELLVAALEARLEALTEILRDLESIPSPQQRLEQLVDRVLSQVEDDPGTFKLYVLLSLECAGNSTLRDQLGRLEERMAHYLGRVEDLFSALGSADPPVEALVFRSTLLGVCLRLSLEADSPTTTGPRAGSEGVRQTVLRLFDPSRR